MTSFLELPLTIEPGGVKNVLLILLVGLTLPVWLAIYLSWDVLDMVRSGRGTERVS